jgi:dsRNA-specific ribonuclease
MQKLRFVIGYSALLVLLCTISTSSTEDDLDYHFKTASLRQQALQPRTHDFERLEFLGDRVLGLATSHFLYKHYFQNDVGWLSENFAKIVSKQGLYKIYLSLNINVSELVSKDYQAPDYGNIAKKTATDIIEALFGAVYLDGGYQSAQTVCENLLKKFYKFKQEDMIEFQTTSPVLQSPKNAKECEVLQETFSYHFKDISLLHEAFRHSSVGGVLYKKLNFIGIHVLNLYLATRIFEDNLTGAEELFVQFFERMTNKDNIAAICQTWEFWRFLDKQSNGTFLPISVSTRMAVDTVRAFIGSVYLDGGFDAVKPAIFQLLYTQSSPNFQLPKPRIIISNQNTNPDDSLNSKDYEEWPSLIEMKPEKEPSYKETDTRDRQNSRTAISSQVAPGLTYLVAAQTSNATTHFFTQAEVTEEWPSLVDTKPAKEVISKGAGKRDHQNNRTTASQTTYGTTYIEAAKTKETTALSTHPTVVEEWPALCSSSSISTEATIWPKAKGPFVKKIGKRPVK